VKKIEYVEKVGLKHVKYLFNSNVLVSNYRHIHFLIILVKH